MAKIHPTKPVDHAVGPTYTVNKSIPFSSGSKSKMKPAKPVDAATGPIRTTNSTHIPTMNANKPAPESKSWGCKPAPQFNPMKATSNTVPQRVASGGSGPSYQLKTSYEK